jgi:hypothetical protein
MREWYEQKLVSTGQEATEAYLKILPRNNNVMTEENHKNLRPVSDSVGDISVGTE